MDERLRAYIRSPQIVAGDVKHGIHRGLVVDNCDPEMRGRARVHIFGLHADYAGTDTELILWAEPIVPFSGSVSPPELGSRVWVTFEAGEAGSPIILGQWYANSTGRGTLPADLHYGSEIPPEVWSTHDQYPEGLAVFRTAEGCAFWALNKLISSSTMESLIRLEDTGGKAILTRSFHLDHPDATPLLDGEIIDQVPANLDGVQIDPGTVTRTGFGSEADVSPGCIQIRIPQKISGGTGSAGPNAVKGTTTSTALSRSLISGSKGNTVDELVQSAAIETDSSAPSVEEYSISGVMQNRRMNGAVFAGIGDSWIFNTTGVTMISSPMLPPRRYD